MKTSIIPNQIMELKALRDEKMRLCAAKEISVKQYNEWFQTELTNLAAELKMNEGDLGFLIISQL